MPALFTLQRATKATSIAADYEHSVAYIALETSWHYLIVI